jgi:hypothetical protein
VQDSAARSAELNDAVGVEQGSPSWAMGGLRPPLVDLILGAMGKNLGPPPSWVKWVWRMSHITVARERARGRWVQAYSNVKVKTILGLIRPSSIAFKTSYCSYIYYH